MDLGFSTLVSVSCSLDYGTSHDLASLVLLLLKNRDDSTKYGTVVPFIWYVPDYAALLPGKWAVANVMRQDIVL